MNMLVYVLLHEISHVFCTNIGHTQEFHDIFEAILKKATELGIYDPTLEIRNDYCTFNDGK
jgi:predicted metal-dependent hydrolase